MRMTGRHLGIAILALGAAVFAAPPTARAEESPVTDEDRADLAWFEGLGYPDAAGRPFVSVKVGQHFEVRGFLLDGPSDRVRLHGLALDEYDLQRSPPGTAEDSRVVVTDLDADRLAEAWLRGGPSPAVWEAWPRPATASIQTQMLVLADALHRADPRRHDALVHGMLAHARSMAPHDYRGHGLGDLTKTLRERVAQDLAEVETYRLKSSLVGQPWAFELIARGRPGQLDAARAILRRFPGSAQEAEVRELADTLERMLREADEHAKAPKTAAEMTADERIADLVFRLRDDPPTPEGDWGGLGRSTTGPYRDLVALGRAAVPRLLDSLADDTLTNQGGTGRNRMSPFVARVGDLVLAAIEEIAGRRFVPADLTALVSDGTHLAQRRAWRAAVRPVIETWLRDPEEGQDPATLTRTVEGGGWPAVSAAPTLLAKDADAYAPAILRALAAEKDVRVHYELLRVLAKHPTEAGVAALREAAKTGDVRGRLDAVFDLVALHDATATDALLAAWIERRDGGGPTGYHQYIHIWSREDDLTKIAKALLATQRADVAKALAEEPLRRSPAARRVLVREFVAARKDAAADVAAILDATLLVLTQDRTEMDGAGWRVRDAAATALAAARGKSAPDASDPLWKRDLAVRAIVDANGFSLAPPPPWDPREFALPEPDGLAAQIDALAANAYGTEPRTEAIRAIEAMGLVALPALRQGLAAKRFGYSIRDVEPLAARLSFTVRKVLVNGTPPQALLEKVAALEGRMLTSGALRDAVSATLAAVGSDACRGASLDLDRGVDDIGAVVTLTALDGVPGGWTASVAATVGGRAVPTTYGQNSIYPPRIDPSIAAICDAALVAPLGERARLHAVAVQVNPN